MKRPRTLKALVALQLLLALIGIVFAAGTTRELLLVRTDTVFSRQPQYEYVIGRLYVGIVAAGLPAVIEGVTAIALWRRASWAWWLGIAVNLLLVGYLFVAAFTENRIPELDLILALSNAVLCPLYFVSPVRRWLFPHDPAPLQTQ